MTTTTATKTKAFDAAKYLDTPEDQAALLADALATGDRGYIAAALGTIARAYGMSRLSEETGLTRSTLYNATSEDGNPTLETILAITSRFGIELGARPRTDEHT